MPKGMIRYSVLGLRGKASCYKDVMWDAVMVSADDSAAPWMLAFRDCHGSKAATAAGGASEVAVAVVVVARRRRRGRRHLGRRPARALLVRGRAPRRRRRPALLGRVRRAPAARGRCRIGILADVCRALGRRCRDPRGAGLLRARRSRSERRSEGQSRLSQLLELGLDVGVRLDDCCARLKKERKHRPMIRTTSEAALPLTVQDRHAILFEEWLVATGDGRDELFACCEGKYCELRDLQASGRGPVLAHIQGESWPSCACRRPVGCRQGSICASSRAV